MAAAIATAGIVLAALYILLMYQRTMTGPVRESTRHMPDLKAREIAALSPLVVLIIVLGFFPQPALNAINPTVDLAAATHVGVTDPRAPPSRRTPREGHQ